MTVTPFSWIKEVFRSLDFSWFGMSQGVLVSLGCFTFAVGILEDDVTLYNRKLILGVLLFSLGQFWFNLSEFLAPCVKTRPTAAFTSVLFLAITVLCCWWLWNLVSGSLPA